MKKLFFAFATLALLTSVSSCKQCGYCKFPSGSNGSAVCKETSVLGSIVDTYDEAKAQCSADGGTWEKTK